MTSDLVPIAAFDSPLTANIARTRLEAEGISPFLANERTVEMQWLWTNAVGGVKLLVPAAEEQRARQILAEVLPPPRDSALVRDFTPGPDEPLDEPSSREQDAARSLKSAVLGLLFCPLQLYTTWLLVLVAMNDEPLRLRYFWYAVGAGAILVP